MSWVALGSAAITAGGTYAASRSGSKRKSPTFEFQPYSGLRPPRIDANGKEYLRPTQDLTQSIIMNRSQGKDVGFDPERMNQLVNLTKNELKTSQDRDLRDSYGRLASAGLSGNPRAYEATAGRINQDYSTKLGNELSRLSIEDLTRRNEERDINTARLMDLNKFNFGQENNAANFDLDVYGAEQGNRRYAAGLDNQNYQYGQDRSDRFLEGLVEFGTDTLSGYGKGSGFTPVQSTTANQAGQGIAPNYSQLMQTPSYYNQPLSKTKTYRNLTSR